MSSPPSDCTINRLYSLKLPPQDLYPSSKFLSNLEARQRSQKERIIRGRRRRRNEGGGSLQHTYITSILKLPHMSQSPSILNLHLPWRGVVQLKAMVYNFITLAANYTFRPLLYTWIHRQYTHRVPFPLQSGKNTPKIHHPCNWCLVMVPLLCNWKNKLTVQEVILIFDSTGRRVCARVHLCAQAWLPSCQARPRDLAFPKNLLQSHRVYMWCLQLVLCIPF